MLEDDYDGEFRFDGKPIECLQALDRDGRVLYAGTASKLLFPALRIGWLVAPPALAPFFLNAKALADTGTPSLEQLALADFIREGHLERHARRARIRTAARRVALLEAVSSELGETGSRARRQRRAPRAAPAPAAPARETPRLRSACRERGVGVYPAAPFYARPPAHAELLLGYAALGEASIRDRRRPAPRGARLALAGFPAFGSRRGSGPRHPNSARLRLAARSACYALTSVISMTAARFTRIRMLLLWGSIGSMKKYGATGG